MYGRSCNYNKNKSIRVQLFGAKFENLTVAQNIASGLHYKMIGILSFSLSLPNPYC